MDLPDCPPGTEGYEDSVIEVPKKLNLDENSCTKAEQEFNDHLESLKIKVEHGETRCMVERRGRDVSGKWIYLCFPCAAVCSGESILQTHISGKKHKTKLSMRNIWPRSIFEEHPYVLTEKGTNKDNKSGATEMILQKMAEEVDYHNNPPELESKYVKYKDVRCHIQDTIDNVKAPLLGLEYLVEHPPEEAHYEPSYICTLCTKQGHPRTIINHLTCFWHRFHYLMRHFQKAGSILSPIKAQPRYREGVGIIINRIAQRIEDTYGRLKPVNIDKEVYEREKDRIHQWLFKGHHFTEKEGCTFEEVCDIDLIESLNNSKGEVLGKRTYDKRDPSPPVVAAPTKPLFNSYTRPAGRQERRANSMDALSDISDEPAPPRSTPYSRNAYEHHTNRYEQYGDKRHESPPKTRYAAAKAAAKAAAADKTQEKQKPHNYEYKVKLAEEQRQSAVEAAKKTLAYHEKNPEKHPLYPEEWKKFWNRRFKEIQAESKDPSKHDFKPEWIVFWTARMKELHDEELRVHVSEIYRKMCLTPPPHALQHEHKRRSPEPKRRSPESMRRSPEHRRPPPEPRRRSPLPPRRRSPIPRRRTPEPRRRSPDPRRRSPIPRRSPFLHRRSPDPRRPVRRPDDRYRVDHRPPPPSRRSMDRTVYSPPRSGSNRTRSRSPIHRSGREVRGTNIDIGRCSRSPLSRRAAAVRLRNRSRTPPPRAPDPALQTVLISDDELKPDDGPSPWNSDNEADSLGSLPEARSPTRKSHAGSERSHSSRPRREYARPAPPSDLGPAENVVATLRLLVALEDYLGSVGPKLVDLLTDALRMEKEKANSSEELLVRDSAVVLIETAKEKLKGAVQAGLVPAAAAAAVRAAVVRAAATLHEADKRSKAKLQPSKSKAKSKPMPVAGVGDVDRAQIAQQMAAALIAQGKTDVSSDELAQLVDAVVGMAEAKKREAVKKVELKQVVVKEVVKTAKVAAPPKTSASALQMLQSAYDENDKKVDKEEAPDAMDGLSDSDLETLLKNFNELSAEEQHSLIAYLKKLEARSPLRVERLRQYVGAAATAATATANDTAVAPAPGLAPAPLVNEPLPQPTAVTIESDDDDYTVEETTAAPMRGRRVRSRTRTRPRVRPRVRARMARLQAQALAQISQCEINNIIKEVFQSATQKVKEDQLRQEMEIVKKSLEETQTVTLPTETKQGPVIDLAKNLSSATDLLALVQASIQSTAKAAPAQAPSASDVVTTSTQPRSFGDLPEPHMATQESRIKSLLPNLSMAQQLQSNQGGTTPLQMNPLNFIGNMSNQSDSYDNQGNWNQRPILNLSENIEPFMQERRSPTLDNRSPLLHDNKGPLLQDNRGPLLQNNRGPLLQDNRGAPMQDNRGSSMQDNRRLPMQDNRGNTMQDNRGGPSMQNNRVNTMQDNRGGPSMQNNRGNTMQENRGNAMQDNRENAMQDIRGIALQDNRGNNMQDNGAGPSMQDNRGPHMQDNWGGPSMQENRGGPSMHDNRGGPSMQDNRGGPSMQDNRGGPSMQDSRGGPSMQDNRGGPFIQNNRGGPSMQDTRGGPSMQDTRGGPSMQDTRGGPSIQDNRGGPLMQDNMGGPTMQDNQGASMQDNQGASMQDNRGPYQQENRGSFMQDNRNPFMPDSRGMSMQNNRNFPMQNNRGHNMQENRGPLLQNNQQPFGQNNRQPFPQNNQQPFGQNNQQPFPQNNQQPFSQNNQQPYQHNNQQFSQDNRGPPQRNFGKDSYNQGPRPNFMNNRMQDQHPKSDQQFGNYDQPKNLRGRGGGRGQFGGPMRGRGRGGYY